MARDGDVNLHLTIEHAEALEEERKISCEVASEYLVSNGEYIGFKYIRDRELSAVKWRNYDKSKIWFEPSGVPKHLFNIDSLLYPAGDTMIITEGEFDCLVAIMAGCTSAVSVPNGAAENSKPDSDEIVIEEDNQFSYLWNDERTDLLPHFAPFKKIIIATDNDKPGRELFRRLAVRFTRGRCYELVYPELKIDALGRPCKDLNEILQHLGLDAVIDCIAEARPIVPNSLVKPSDIPDLGEIETYKTGWSQMDDHLKLVPPELMVVTGAPGSGKSQWTLCFLMQMARYYNLRSAYLQFEDNPQRNKRHLLAYAKAFRMGQDQDKPVGHYSEQDAERLAWRWIDGHFRLVAPPEDDLDSDQTLRWVEDRIEEAVKRHSCKIVVLDPWNEIEHIWSRTQNETQYTNDALRMMKKLARRYRIAIIIVAHPSKLGGMEKDISKLSLYDISGSSAWKNKADHGVIVHRAEGDGNVTYIKIDKSKDYETMGAPGIVQFEYQWKNAFYTFKQKGI